MKTEFITAVTEHNLSVVRMMLSNELLLDPRGNTFSEMLSYAKENLEDLFEENRESEYEIPSDKVQWNIKLVSRLKSDLISNFSVEKLALFQELVMWVGRDKAESLNEYDATSRRSKEKHDNIHVEEPQTNSWREFIKGQKTGTLTCVGGVVLCLVGTACKGAACTFIEILGGVAIVGGVILNVVKKEK